MEVQDKILCAHVKHFFFFAEVLLIYSLVSLSAVQQSDSVIHIQILFFRTFFSIMVYYIILNIVPCDIQ